MSTPSINCHRKKVQDCYILHTVLLLNISIDSYCYWKSLCKTSKYNRKLKIMNFKKFTLQIAQRYYFDDIIKLDVFDLNVFLDEKSLENILVYEIWYKTFIDSKPLRIRFDEIDRFIKMYDETRFSYCLVLKNTIFFSSHFFSLFRENFQIWFLWFFIHTEKIF